MKQILLIGAFLLLIGQAHAEDNHVPSVSEFEGIEAGDRRELVSDIFFRWCPAGTFTMGSPETELHIHNRRNSHRDDEYQVEVTLTEGFWLGETEATQGQWTQLMETTPWTGKKGIKDSVNYPATYVSDADAAVYCRMLTKQERKAGRLPQGWTYSLPTEAQWEYACRAGTITAFSFGDDEMNLSDYGWWGYENTAIWTEQFTAHEVGLKKPNAWGLKDMHGNVQEMCSDWYVERLPGGRDPQGPSTGSYRVSRGGAWVAKPPFCRSAFRGTSLPNTRTGYRGFRIAAVPDKQNDD